LSIPLQISPSSSTGSTQSSAAEAIVVADGLTMSPASVLPPESIARGTPQTVTNALATASPARPPPPMPSQIKIVEKPQMLEINPGIWDGLSPEQVKKYYPEDWDRFVKDPYSYRAPRAESYHDLSGTSLLFLVHSSISAVVFLTTALADPPSSFFDSR